jgi:D-glycero-alpha-D-manno-heptose-7-phosphate kinase
MKVVRSRTPLRISFGGGGTDVPPYPATHGGVVLNATINRYIYASLVESTEHPDVRIRSLDFDSIATYRSAVDLEFNGQFDLAKAVIRHFAPDAGNGGPGIDVYVHGDAPPGSGLGTSSTFTVALINVFREWRKIPMDSYEIAALAHHIEREVVGIKGGRQDQYSAVFGGFNFMDFSENDTVITPLKIDPTTVCELEYNLMLVFTKGVRESQRIIEHQTANVHKAGSGAIAALDEIKQLALAMKRALLQGKLTTFGQLLHESWEQKKRMSTMISNDYIDEIYAEARRLGVLGGKITGAGGGGYMMLYTPFDKAHAVRLRMKEMGCEIVDYRFELNSAQSWRARI